MNKLKYGALCIVLLIASGCTALQPFPNMARGGDTISLALGSPSNMSRANTTATFTDVNGVPTDITANIRSIFKLYADPASKVYNGVTDTVALVNLSGHSPWITIAAVDLPAGLAVGSGNIQFNTTAIYPTGVSHINDIQLPVEIIPGTGSANNFEYEFGTGSSKFGNLNILEPQKRTTFGPTNPSIACPCPDYAAIEVKVTIPATAGSIPSDVRVIPTDLGVVTGSGRNVLHGVSSNGQQLTVSFLSPTGFLKYYEAGFDVVLPVSATPTVDSVKYFALDGTEVAGPVADYNVLVKN